MELPSPGLYERARLFCLIYKVRELLSHKNHLQMESFICAFENRCEKKGFVWQYQKFQASPIYTSKLYAMKGTYRGLRLNNFLQKTIKIPVIPVKNAWTIVLWWKCESRLAWIWTSKSSSQQQSRCLHNLDCEFNQISAKEYQTGLSIVKLLLYLLCCNEIFKFQFKYTTRESETRHSIVAVILQ